MLMIVFIMKLIHCISFLFCFRDTLRSLCRIRQKIVGFAATVARVPSNLPPPGQFGCPHPSGSRIRLAEDGSFFGLKGSLFGIYDLL